MNKKKIHNISRTNFFKALTVSYLCGSLILFLTLFRSLTFGLTAYWLRWMNINWSNCQMKIRAGKKKIYNILVTSFLWVKMSKCLLCVCVRVSLSLVLWLSSSKNKNEAKENTWHFIHIYILYERYRCVWSMTYKIEICHYLSWHPALVGLDKD